jgi:hypothetical protein
MSSSVLMFPALYHLTTNYDLRFTVNQFILAPSLLRLMTRFIFEERDRREGTLGGSERHYIWVQQEIIYLVLKVLRHCPLVLLVEALLMIWINCNVQCKFTSRSQLFYTCKVLIK